MTVETNKWLVFVYGTLKREYGGRAHIDYLANKRQVGTCCVPGVMLHLGAYPGLVDDDVCFTTGEVYEVDAVDIASMDRYESVPHLYTRKLVSTPWGNAWAYFKTGCPIPVPNSLTCVDRGIWLGSEKGKVRYDAVRDFYANKRYNEPNYRALPVQPIVPNAVVPAHVQHGVWNDQLKAFVYPDGTMHKPPGTEAKGTDVLKTEVPASKPEWVPIRANMTEMM